MRSFLGSLWGPVLQEGSRSEQVEKSSCNAVSTKELFQVETWGSSLCGHLSIERSRMQADSRSGSNLA